MSSRFESLTNEQKVKVMERARKDPEGDKLWREAQFTATRCVDIMCGLATGSRFAAYATAKRAIDAWNIYVEKVAATYRDEWDDRKIVVVQR